MKWNCVRRLATGPIRLYQYCISPLFPARCRYYPTCSEYARKAVLAHGIGKGAWLAIQRLLRCHPWSAGGYDPVPAGKDSP